MAFHFNINQVFLTIVLVQTVQVTLMAWNSVGEIDVGTYLLYTLTRRNVLKRKQYY